MGGRFADPDVQPGVTMSWFRNRPAPVAAPRRRGGPKRPARPAGPIKVRPVPRSPRRRFRRRHPRWTVLLPAYNEAAGIPAMAARLGRLAKDGYEVVVVDDGSTDGTGAVARSHGLHVVRHERNAGKAAAVRTGVRFAGGRDIIVIDADDTYPVERIPEVAGHLEHYDYVVGVRTLSRHNISFLNRIGNEAFRFVISLVAGHGLADPLSGLYGIRRLALEQMDLQSNGFAVEAEIAVKACRGRLRVAHMSIEYRPRIGTSKLHPIRDGIAILREALQHRAWRPKLPVGDSETLEPGSRMGTPTTIQAPTEIGKAAR